MILELALFGMGFSLILNHKYPHPFGETEYWDLFRLQIYSIKGNLIYNRRYTKAYNVWTYLPDYFVATNNGKKTCFFLGTPNIKYGFLYYKQQKYFGKFIGNKY